MIKIEYFSKGKKTGEFESTYNKRYFLSWKIKEELEDNYSHALSEKGKFIGNNFNMLGRKLSKKEKEILFN